jgi:hypothetical protein
MDAPKVQVNTEDVPESENTVASLRWWNDMLAVSPADRYAEGLFTYMYAPTAMERVNHRITDGLMRRIKAIISDGEGKTSVLYALCATALHNTYSDEEGGVY